MKYKGQIADFPKEVVEAMLNEQERQGSKRDVSVFEEHISRARGAGGFDWYKSKEGHDFWNEVIHGRRFEIFFEKYPEKQNGYPRLMWVSSAPITCPGKSDRYLKRVVFMEKNGKFLAWKFSETLEDAEKESTCLTWDYVKDIEEEPELESGKWYKHDCRLLIYVTAVERVGEGIHPHNRVHYYGFNRGEWGGKDYFANKDIEKELKPATKKEVEEALIAEAKRRGLKTGIRLSLPDGNDVLFKSVDRGMFFERGVLYWHSNFYPIFRNGVWAEILPDLKEVTLEQIAEKFSIPLSELRIKE